MVWRVAASVVWLLLICYPDPRVLWQSIVNTVQPPIDPESVREWARGLPDDPAAIERAVLARIRYAVPWQKDGVPWTFPAPAEIVAAGYGDCQGRALVFASLLAAKGIPYQLRASLDHMWVEYQGKPPNALENDAATLWTRRRPPEGPLPTPPAVNGPGAIKSRPWLTLPALDLAESYRIEKEYFWDAAPDERKLVLVLGLAIIWAWSRRLRPRWVRFPDSCE